jgi:hypothetical protein
VLGLQPDLGKHSPLIFLGGIALTLPNSESPECSALFFRGPISRRDWFQSLVVRAHVPEVAASVPDSPSDRACLPLGWPFWPKP